jgi:serine/threonine-protein kinase
MSRVYLGTHVRLARKAALKLVDTSSASPATIARLLDEARVVNSIRHPNIIDISDFVEEPDRSRITLVMEYIEGPNLATLRGFSFSLDQATGIGLQLLDALAAAHAGGVIHRDIKPANLLLTSDPRSPPHRVPTLKVVDFGVAKIFGSGHRTVTGAILGTPAYMAPEQIAGRPQPSGATDVFAVGEVIYEIFSGEPAYAEKSVLDMVRIKLRGEVPVLKPLRAVSLMPYVDADASHAGDQPVPVARSGEGLRELLTRCLAPRPQDRPSLADIKECLDGLLLSPAEAAKRKLRSSIPPEETELAPSRSLQSLSSLEDETGGMPLPPGSVPPPAAKTELLEEPLRGIRLPPPAVTAPGSLSGALDQTAGTPLESVDREMVTEMMSKPPLELDPITDPVSERLASQIGRAARIDDVAETQLALQAVEAEPSDTHVPLSRDESLTPMPGSISAVDAVLLPDTALVVPSDPEPRIPSTALRPSELDPDSLPPIGLSKLAHIRSPTETSNPSPPMALISPPPREPMPVVRSEPRAASSSRPWLIVLVLLAAATATLAIVVFAMTHLR